jgi:hypothetical protein
MKGKTMSKNEARKKTNALNPKPGMDRARSAYPVEPAELDRQQGRVKKAADSAKNALKTGAIKVEFPPPMRTASAQAQTPHPSEPSTSRPTMKPLDTPPRSKIVNVSFVLIRPGAARVSLCGEFNGWSPDAGPMTRHDDGHWEAIVALSPGRYEYKFLVDGEWLADPVVEQTVVNGFGSLNSIIEVREGPANRR